MLPIGLDQDGDVYTGGRQVGIRVDPEDGGFYLAADMEGKGKGIGWAAAGIFARIGKADSNGKWIWMTGSKATGDSKPGQFCKPSQFMGIINGWLFVGDWNGQIRIFDKNTGLYAGSVLRENADNSPSDEYMMNVELTEGQVFRSRLDGNDYVVAGECCGQKVFQISGLDEIERFSAPVVQ